MTSLRLATPRWAKIGASVRGGAHGRKRRPGEDALRAGVLRDADGGALLAVAVSDGAGSAAYAAMGSAMAAEAAIVSAALAAASAPEHEFNEDWMRTVLADAQARVLAGIEGDVRDYSATLLLAVLGESGIIAGQIGDGAIVFQAGSGAWDWLTPPQQRGRSDLTHFLIEPDAAQHAAIGRLTGATALALMSDGLQDCALNAREQRPHAPFFGHVFGLWRAWESGLRSPEQRLAAWLNGPVIRDCSDDDKTLALCRRRA